MPKTVISNDDDAYAQLEGWLQGKELTEVEFNGWPKLNIEVKGEHYDSSLNSEQMAALIELKMTVGRAYSALAHGAYDMRRLKQDEEEDLQFITTLNHGSSILDTDLTPLVRAISEAIKLHPQMAIAAGLVIGLAMVSREAIVRHFENRAKQLDIEERKNLLSLGLTAGESRRYGMVEAATRKLENAFPQFSQALVGAQAAYWKFASASADADTVSVAGLTLSHEDLQILSERRKRRDRRIRVVEEVFTVKSVGKDGSFRYKISLESERLSTVAVYKKPQMTETRIRRLFKAMSSSTKISARLEVKMVDRAKMGSRLISFKVLDPSESAE